jgi:hypothetical protein
MPFAAAKKMNPKSPPMTQKAATSGAGWQWYSKSGSPVLQSIVGGTLMSGIA